MFGFLKKKNGETAHAAQGEPAAQAEAPAEPSTPAAGAPALAVQTAPAEAAPEQAVEVVVPPRQDPSAIIAEFEKELERQEDRLYGIALFFECVSLLYAGRSGVLETNRKQFRNIIVAGHTAIGQGRALAAKVRQDPGAIGAVRAFRFTYCEGHPNPIGLAARADALLKAYRNLFPVRPQDKAFSEEETYRLLEAAAEIVRPVLDG
jgi:hypothetical protein